MSVYILNSSAIQYPAADENEEKQRLLQVIIQNEITCADCEFDWKIYFFIESDSFCGKCSH